eukprot:GDKJ01050008.1.p1 GENE.GDKJ01050008.1~~GDKJ01050008.1.p1  ORF type:complete len:463 (+),score=98.41 GDKJ01050008.1:182-1570(+)
MLSLTYEEIKRLNFNTLTLTLFDENGNRCYEPTIAVNKLTDAIRVRGIGGVYFSGAEYIGNGQFFIKFALIKRQFNAAMLPEETRDVLQLSEPHKVFVTIANCQVSSSPFSPRLLPHDPSNPTNDLLKASRFQRTSHPLHHVLPIANEEAVEAAIHTEALQEAIDFNKHFGVDAENVLVGPLGSSENWAAVRSTDKYHLMLPVAHKTAVKKSEEASDLRNRILEVAKPIERAVASFRSANIEFLTAQTKSIAAAKERTKIKKDIEMLSKSIVQKGMNNNEISKASANKENLAISSSRFRFFQDRALGLKNSDMTKIHERKLREEQEATLLKMMDPTTGKISMKRVNVHEMLKLMEEVSELTTRELLRAEHNVIDDLKAQWCQPIRIIQQQRKQYKALKTVQGELEETLLNLLSEERDLDEEEKEMQKVLVEQRVNQSSTHAAEIISLKEQQAVMITKPYQIP